MAVSLLLLAAVIALVNGGPQFSLGDRAEEQKLIESIMTTHRCLVTFHVVYPDEEGELPYPLCSSRCPGGEELWIDGVVFKRLAELENINLMVKMTYKNGNIHNCTMVPFQSADEYAARQEAIQQRMASGSAGDAVSLDETLVLSVTERIPGYSSSLPDHERLQGFTRVGDAYYMVSPNVMNYHDAVEYCHKMGASLAFVESSTEQELLQGVLSTDVWIGLNDIVAEGIFVNEGNTPITYSKEVNKNYMI